MIRRVDLRGTRHSKAEVQDLLPRATLDVNEAMTLITPILSRVKNGVAEDLYSLSEEFDGVRPPSLRVPQSALDAALAEHLPQFADDLPLRRLVRIGATAIHAIVVHEGAEPFTDGVLAARRLLLAEFRLGRAAIGAGYPPALLEMRRDPSSVR